MSPKKTARMSPEQTVYTVARAVYETLLDERAARFAAAGLKVTREMSDEDAERVFLAQGEIEHAIGLDAARTSLRAAEQAMVAWAIAHACRFSPAHATLLGDLQARAQRSVVRWEELVGICFKLAA
jgi:hypothetical protein